MHNLTPKRPDFTPSYAHLSQVDKEQLRKLKDHPGLFSNMFARQIENGFDDFAEATIEPRESPMVGQMDLFPFSSEP